jgi:hypothetical protein
MVDDHRNDDRAAIEETLRLGFTDPDASADDLLWGPLRDWQRLRGENPKSTRLDTRHTLERVDIVELSDTHAVVDLRGEVGTVVTRGTREWRTSLDGPAALQKVDGSWRIIDFTVDGRRRLETIVQGQLAAQSQSGLTLRVLGVDRATRATEFLLELVNGGTEPVRVDRAFALFETQTAWARTHIRVAAGDSIPGGGSSTVLLTSSNGLELSDHMTAIALRVRAGSRKLPFLLKVPLTPPGEVVPQRPPRRLPTLRSTWPRSLVFYAALTAAAYWWYGWFAIVVPMYVALAVYWQIRVNGKLPERLYPGRRLVDAAVMVAAFLIVWE